MIRRLTKKEVDEVSIIINATGSIHGFELAATVFFKAEDGRTFLEITVKPIEGSGLSTVHCIGVLDDGRPLRDMAADAAMGFEDWADRKRQKMQMS